MIHRIEAGGDKRTWCLHRRNNTGNIGNVIIDQRIYPTTTASPSPTANIIRTSTFMPRCAAARRIAIYDLMPSLFHRLSWRGRGRRRRNQATSRSTAYAHKLRTDHPGLPPRSQARALSPEQRFRRVRRHNPSHPENRTTRRSSPSPRWLALPSSLTPTSGETTITASSPSPSSFGGVLSRRLRAGRPARKISTNLRVPIAARQSLNRRGVILMETLVGLA